MLVFSLVNLQSANENLACPFCSHPLPSPASTASPVPALQPQD